jgi:hypothetical protein
VVAEKRLLVWASALFGGVYGRMRHAKLRGVEFCVIVSRFVRSESWTSWFERNAELCVVRDVVSVWILGTGHTSKAGQNNHLDPTHSSEEEYEQYKCPSTKNTPTNPPPHNPCTDNHPT